jgi:hypothetical protein
MEINRLEGPGFPFAGTSFEAGPHGSDHSSSSQAGADPRGLHHLLKHSLSDGQRIEALRHFDCTDAKDAARVISKMGQRDLQAKFRLVYGAPTHSNNNDWLRRKLFEAVGAAPLKPVVRPRPRKQARGPRSGGSPPTEDGVFDDDYDQRRSKRVPKG